MISSLPPCCVTPLVSVLASFLIAGSAFGQVPKIDGYDGFKFGMTVEQAQGVKGGLTYKRCDYKNAVGCMDYAVNVGAFPATVVVQFKGSPARVAQILVSFDSLRSPPKDSCSSVRKEVLRLLTAKYGSSPYISDTGATWTSPHGGSLRFSSLCIDNTTGMNVISYEPSAAL